MDDALAHNIVPLVDQFLSVIAYPLFTVYMNQFGNPDGQDFKFSRGAWYVLGSQKFKYNIERQWLYVCLLVQYSGSSTN
jgi:hypothetical protein